MAEVSKEQDKPLKIKGLATIKIKTNTTQAPLVPVVPVVIAVPTKGKPILPIVRLPSRKVAPIAVLPLKSTIKPVTCVKGLNVVSNVSNVTNVSNVSNVTNVTHVTPKSVVKPTLKPVIKLAVKIATTPTPTSDIVSQVPEVAKIEVPEVPDEAKVEAPQVVPEKEKAKAEVPNKAYKFRAETISDVQNLYDLSDFQENVTDLEIMIDPMGFPDVDVSFKSTLSIDKLLSLIARVPDAHVAVESLDYSENYTGERFRDDDIEPKLDCKKNPKKIPESCIKGGSSADDCSLGWPNQDYIEMWLGSIEHQLKFHKQDLALVQELKQEVEKLRASTNEENDQESISKIQFDTELSRLNKMLNDFIATLDPEEADDSDDEDYDPRGL